MKRKPRKRKIGPPDALVGFLECIRDDANKYLQRILNRLGPEKGSITSLIRPMTEAERTQMPRALGISGVPFSPLKTLSVRLNVDGREEEEPTRRMGGTTTRDKRPRDLDRKEEDESCGTERRSSGRQR